MRFKHYMSFALDQEAVKVDAFCFMDRWNILCLSPFQHSATSAAEGTAGPGLRSVGGTQLANTGVVSSPKPHAPHNARAASTQRQCAAATQTPRESPPTHPEESPPTTGLQDVQKDHAEAGLTADVVDLLMHSWWSSTAKAYTDIALISIDSKTMWTETTYSPLLMLT